MKKILVILLMLCFSSVCLLGQKATNWQGFNELRNAKQQKAMCVLGAWSVINMGSGAILQTQTEGESKYFHSMNLIWNTVNFAIAGYGLYSIKKADPGSLDAAASIKAQHHIQKVLLFNAGLDVGYIMLGLWYHERGNSSSDTEEANRRRGYGKSIMLQGGFLLLFDSITALVLSHDNHKIEHLLDGIAFNGNSLSLRLRF